MRTTSPGHRLVFPAIIAAAMMSGMACDRNDPHGPDDGAAMLLLEGTVASDVGGSVAGAAVLLEATGTNSGVVVAAAVTDSGGRYSIDVEIPDGCSAAGVSVTVEATRHHHRHAVVAAPQVACGARQTLDVIMVREGFPTPQPVQGGLVAEQISAGISPTCATTTTGAWCWGPPIVLAGPHDGSHAAVPEPVFGGTRFTHVEGGMNHVCALDDGGSAWCWGRDSGGRLGVAGVERRRSPCVSSRISAS